MDSLQSLSSNSEIAQGNTSPNPASSSVQDTAITRIDRKLYEAAVQGNFQEFTNVLNIDNLLTPNKNTILHVHLTSRKTQTEETQFVEQILGKCKDLVLKPNAKGETPLHIAARYGHCSIAKLMIEHAKAFPRDIENETGAEKELIRAINHENDTALHEAVRYRRLKMVEMLLAMDPDHSYCANNANETPLYLASERRLSRMVSRMLEIMKSPAYGGPSDQTALHAAVINRHIKTARVLVENEHVRAAVKHKDKKGWVPLHYAAKIGDRRLTKLLLEQDENTAYMQDNEGRTALHIAAYCNHRVVMSMIIEYYPDCSEIVDNKGWNALHYAVNGYGFCATGKIMCNLSLSNLYNEKDFDGNTPLHYMASSRFVCEGLVFHCRVDRRAINKQDQTALDVVYGLLDSDNAIANQRFLWLLKRFGVKPNQRLDLKWKDPEEKFSKLVFTPEAKQTHLVVATLIATVSFAAGFTLPGGTILDGEHKGSPILRQNASFHAFMVSNTMSLVLAASAALIHLFSPLNNAKWMDHYLSGVAFSFTLLSVATMIVAFTTGAYAVLGSSAIGIAVILIGLSYFLVFRQVLKERFRGNFLIPFIADVVKVLLFFFKRLIIPNWYL